MLKDLEFLCWYITQRAKAPSEMTKLTESDYYTMGYVDGLAEVLSVLADLIEEYRMRMEDHDD